MLLQLGKMLEDRCYFTLADAATVVQQQDNGPLIQSGLEQFAEAVAYLTDGVG